MPRALTWTQEVIRHSFLSLQADLQRRKDHCWLKAPSGWTHSPYLDPQISSDFLTFSALNKLLLQISWQIELLRIISGPVMSTAELECPAMDSFCSLKVMQPGLFTLSSPPALGGWPKLLAGGFSYLEPFITCEVSFPNSSDVKTDM